ncbi:Elongation factor 1-gamma [Modicella reniformis]|uniref:Elongation factor 1-gamma n=1 Tax=Modicella reniformis TaxID=1440133 RepID=A0A9P6LYJ9_9FUNG|nr:Elongation factor 1-gamma [Modicella reniformis]
MTVGTIYTYPQNPRVFKALVVAKYNGLEVKVPAFEGTDGTIIIESGAIAYYLAHMKSDSTLIGRSNVEEAHIQQWVQFVDCSITPALMAWLYPIWGFGTYNKMTETQSIEKVKSQLEILERHLVKKTFLVGERVTLADIAVSTSLYVGYKLVFDAEFRKLFPAVTRWFTTIVNQPNFKAVAGDLPLCETALKYVAPKKETKEKKPKEEKPKEEKKPKEENPQDDAEENFEDAPKPKSTLELLPAAKMPLDEWKRQYSNNETPVAMKWLWENIDLGTDYSIWKVDYKYNNELTKLYMSNNLAGGLMNRLERARKYAFGCLVVAGEDNANIITGYFIVRGNADEMIEEITDAADYDSYNWVKVNVDDAVKAKINQIFAWDGTVDGKPIMDGKVFK